MRWLRGAGPAGPVLRVNRAKAKGTAWETAIVRFLQGCGLGARRKVQTGRVDTGDIHVGRFTLEAKDVAKIELASFVDQAEREAEAAGTDFGAAVVKRRRHGVEKAYVVMSLEQLARIMEELGDEV